MFHCCILVYIDRFLEHIVQYSLDWFNAIENRVSTSLKKAHKLRKELEHYESKCSRLRLSKGRVAKSGTRTDAYLSVQAKLQRNENKLQLAKREYNSFTEQTTALVYEVTNNCWKDLFPILMKLTQFDSSLVSDENKLLQNLTDVTRSLSVLQETYKLKPETRLPELEQGLNFLVDSKNQAYAALSTSSDNEEAKITGGLDENITTMRSDRLRIITPQASNVKETSQNLAIGNTRISSFLESSNPKIEVDVSTDSDESRDDDNNEENHNRSAKILADQLKYSVAIQARSHSKPPSNFTGKSRDQNASKTLLKKKKSKKKRQSTTDSYCESKASSCPFDDIECDESVAYPLSPVRQYRV